MTGNVSTGLKRALSLTLSFLLFLSSGVLNIKTLANTNSISVQFYNTNRSTTSTTIGISFRITNTGTTSINLSDIKFRYYFTDDGISSISTAIDYASNSSNFIGNYITYSINSINTTNANRYMEYGFNGAAGSIAPNSYAEVNSRIFDTNYSGNFNQSNDYSFNSSAQSYTSWNKVTTYVGGALASGTEPTGSYSTSTPTSTPSSTPKPTSTMTPTPASNPTPNPVSTPTPIASGSGIQKYEAENVNIGGGAGVYTNHGGYSGTGFVAGYVNEGASTTFNINVNTGGTYALSLRYSNGMGSSQKISIYLNGSNAKDVYYPATANWDSWTEKMENFNLNAGNNTIMFRRDSGDGVINLDYITVVIASQATQTGNLLSNGDFSMGTNLWFPYAHSGAESNFSIENGQAKLAITNVGTANWHAGVGQINFSLISGKAYKMSFDARSTLNRKIVASVHNSSTYVNYMYKEIDLTNNMNRHSFYFVMNTSDTNSRVAFDVGYSSSLNSHDIYIDNVVIEETTEYVPPTPTPGNNTEIIKNGSFSNNNANWIYQGSGNGQVINGEYVINITNLGENSWSNQLYQKPFILISGKTYKLSFNARVNTGRQVRVFVSNGSAYNDYISIKQNVDQNMNLYSYTFTMVQTDSMSMFGVDLGMMDGAALCNFYIDNVKIEEVASSNTPTPTPTSKATPTHTPKPTPTPLEGANLALGKNVYVSSEENGYGNVKTNSVDGNYSTRWASGWSDNQWIYVDLESVKTFNRVKLHWEVSYGKSYKIQVSNDGNTWSDVYTNNTSDGGLDDIIFSSTNARYVRMYGITRAIDYGFSLWEFEVYNSSIVATSTPVPTNSPTPSPTSTPVPTPSATPVPGSTPTLTPTPTVSYSPQPTIDNRINIALNKFASTDSSQSISYSASMGNDGNTGSRWSASDSNINHWWMVDLGSISSITGTQVVWEFGGRVYKYKIEVSGNNSTWTTVVDKTGNASTLQVQEDTFNAPARYVKITVTGMNNGSIASFWELKVFGQAGGPPSPAPTPFLPDGQLVKNGKFDDGSTHWGFISNESSGSNAYNIITQVDSDNVSKTTISNTGTQLWGIQVFQGDITLEKNKRYRLTFDSSASIERGMKIEIASGTSSVRYFENTTNISPTIKNYTYEFNMNSNTDKNCKLIFNMGKPSSYVSGDHNVILDNITLKVVASVLDPSPSSPSEDVNASFSPSRSSTSNNMKFGVISDMEFDHGGDITVNGTITGKKEIAMVLDNSGAFNSYIKDTISPFDFGVFADNLLHVQGNDALIDGSTYSKNFSTISSQLTITETCMASSFFVTTPTLNVNKFENVYEPIKMPLFHNSLITEATLAGQVFDPTRFPWGINVPMPGQTGVNIRYEHYNSRFVITGGGTLEIDKSMYFKGNVMISLGRSDNTGNAFLVADGDIIIQGNDLSPIGPNDKMYVYSIGGNIEFQTTNSTINGIAYAPGSPHRPDSTGNIRFIGMNNNVTGSVVGKNVNLLGGGLTINSNYSSAEELEQKYAEHATHLNLIKIVAKDFIDRFSGTDTKLALIKYAGSANNSNLNYYDLSNPAQVSSAIAFIDEMAPESSGLSNMGDGMRRAKEILTDPVKSSENASKYTIVLAGSIPNKWTSTNAGLTAIKTDGGNALHLGGDGSGDVDGSAYNYAGKIGEEMNNLEIQSIFIDFAPDNIQNRLESIAQSSGSKLVESTGMHLYKANDYSELTSIFEFAYINTHDKIILNNVLYEELFPEGIKIIEAPEGMRVEPVQFEGYTRHKATGVINWVELKFDGSKYVLEGENFTFKLRFLKPGDITFEGLDSSITYKIQYIDESGITHTEDVIGRFNDLIITVDWDIDIG